MRAGHVVCSTTYMSAAERHVARGGDDIDPTFEAAPLRGWRRWARRLVSREPERLAGFGGAVAAGFLLSLVLMYAFIWLADQVLEQETTALDQAAAQFARQFSSPQMDIVAQVLSLMGSEVVFVAGSLLVAIWLFQRRWGAATMLVLITLGAQLLNDLLKQTFHRIRPEQIASWIAAQQYSFPSG